MKGYVQLYTGMGKGKTTAALGQALRAAGAGLKIYIGQFLKGRYYSELNSLKRFSDLITVRQYGRGVFINNKPIDDDFLLAKKGFQDISTIVHEGKHELVILDEINMAIWYKLVSVDSVLDLIKTRPYHVELILTGRMADPQIIDASDLVTEMKDIKHYATTGVKSRVGIEL